MLARRAAHCAELAQPVDSLRLLQWLQAVGFPPHLANLPEVELGLQVGENWL